MDRSRALRLIREAVDRGVCAPYVAELTRDSFSINGSDRSRRDVLLRVYERRLSRALNREVEETTARLVDFLRDCSSEFLRLLSVENEAGDYEMFIVDDAEEQILFWLSMFSRRMT